LQQAHPRKLGGGGLSFVVAVRHVNA
jgi:hypothetical protein